MPSFLDCPDEILVQIFTHTRRLYGNHVELNILCQTCKRFERIARPLLVHRITHHPEPAIGTGHRREQTASIIRFFFAHPDLIKKVKEVHITPSPPQRQTQNHQRNVDPLTTEERRDVIAATQSFYLDIQPNLVEDFMNGIDRAYYALLPLLAGAIESIIFDRIGMERIDPDSEENRRNDPLLQWLTPISMRVTPLRYGLLGKHLGSLRHLVLKDTTDDPILTSRTWGLFLLLPSLETFHGIDMRLSLLDHTQRLVPWIMGHHISRVEDVTFERCLQTPNGIVAFLRACRAIKKLTIIRPVGIMALFRGVRYLAKAVHVHRSTLEELTLDLIPVQPADDSSDDDSEPLPSQYMCMELASFERLRRLRITEELLFALAYKDWWKPECRTLPRALRMLEVARSDDSEGVDKLAETEPWWRRCSPATTHSHLWHRFEKDAVIYEEAMSRLGLGSETKSA